MDKAVSKRIPDPAQVGSESDPPDGQQVAGTQTLVRGIALLECVATGAGDLRSISASLGLSRSTTHRLLNSLVSMRLLDHVPYKGYLLGPKLIQLGMQALEQRPLVTMAHPHLVALAERTGDTIHLGSVEDAEVLYLDKIPGTRGLEMRSRVGMRMPLASTGIGKALMLGLPRSEWPGLYERARSFSVQGLNRPSLPSLPEFEERMDGYVQCGWSFDLEENEIGIRGVGAPIRDARNEVVAAISVASALPFMPDERMAELGPIVRATAEAISEDLGWKAR